MEYPQIKDNETHLVFILKEKKMETSPTDIQ